MRPTPFSLQVPFENEIVMSNGKVSQRWGFFFRMIQSLLNPLGRERFFDLKNNQSSTADIDDFQFDSTKAGSVYVDYLIQRITTSTGAVELMERGSMFINYRPTALTWDMLIMTTGPDDAGITFSISATGQVGYQSTNELGTASVSRFIWRARTFSAKNYAYSEAG